MDLGLRPREAWALTPREWTAIADRYLERQKLADHRWATVHYYLAVQVAKDPKEITPEMFLSTATEEERLAIKQAREFSKDL